MKDSLVSPVRFPFESNRWYTVRMTCEYERVRCYVDGVLLHEVDMRPIPSLVSVATLDKENREYDPPRGEDLFAYRGSEYP